MTATLTAPARPAPSTSDTVPPRWVRPAFWGLLLATAVLYLWNLGASGWANSFYAEAAQAGSMDWKAWFFGSLDPGNTITVDKPPAALWLMGLSGRIFGFSSWSMLVPQALLGVGSVVLLYAAVRRWSGPGAGLLAGAALAVTPVAALMFRFNNPDALLTFLLVLGGYCVVRALEKASPKWLALAGVAIGFGFLAKMMQAFLVLPAFGLVYLIAAPTGLGKRLLHLFGAAVTVVVSAGWYIAVVDLWPASSRPYIGGSADNTELDLALGYNGLGRIFGGAGNGGGMGGAGGGNIGFGGETGLGRMFGDSFGTEVSWLLPAALIGLVAGLWFTRWRPRTDRTRAALVLWGGWLVVTALVFSYMEGTVHPYYAVALAPAITAVVAISGRELWRGREHLAPRLFLAGMVAVTAVWSYILLDRSSAWQPAIRWTILVLGILVATAVAVGVHEFRRVTRAVAVAAVTVGLAGTLVFGMATAAVPHSGSIPISGPASGMAFGMPEGEAPSADLVAALQASPEQWAAASNGTRGAAALQLVSGKSVMPIGGFNGGDPAPTLAQFQQYVAEGKIGYYITDGGRMGGPGGGSNEIAEWVEANFTATTIGGQSVYDLTP
ncbi:glycosyltransferase family 39 protein [Amycolatopsis sp. YIM 10]|uniref:ArnT family glycosyltransferase n=1 Tax=Amycolatopsis sp. YIM 10 TaxID=2653857 RepID=UPI0012901173|nr:glycosyltransferase family 39 protein [Amycolatopsis sp. YIM 10]QFU92204.1 Dolichyl-phosphate-mannose-protein mannosyltransferase [Amycolatopsis sp. YIM 10]